jgi:hypothetical protein
VGLYAGGGIVTPGGRREGVNQKDSFPWLDYGRGLPVHEKNDCYYLSKYVSSHKQQ